jgi:hypothetical protein
MGTSRWRMAMADDPSAGNLEAHDLIKRVIPRCPLLLSSLSSLVGLVAAVGWGPATGYWGLAAWRPGPPGPAAWAWLLATCYLPLATATCRLPLAACRRQSPGPRGQGPGCGVPAENPGAWDRMGLGLASGRMRSHGVGVGMGPHATWGRMGWLAQGSHGVGMGPGGQHGVGMGLAWGMGLARG